MSIVNNRELMISESRTFNWDKRCQLCHDDLVTFAVPATQAVDDVTDHDLYHC